MFLAVRDLRFARGRFALMGAVVSLVAVLAVVLSGLTTGLATDNISALRDLPARHLAFQRGVEGDLFARSTVQASAAKGLGGAAFGAQITHATSQATGKDLDLTLFGMEPGSFLAPRGLGDGVLVSAKLAEQGVRPGDTLLVERSGVRLTVTGTVGDESYSHIAVAYVPLRLWQRVHYGLPGEPPAQAYDEATAIAFAGDAPAVRGLHVLTREQSYAASPGYTAETGTFRLIQGFLYVISTFVVGAFFVVWIVQRRPEIALVRALGGSAAYLVRDALGQVALVLVAATGVGAAVGAGLCALLARGPVPIALETAPLLTAAALMVLLGFAGAFAAVRRITSVDPLLVLGANR